MLFAKLRFPVGLVTIPDLLRARILANESAAVGALRTLNMARISYYSTYGTVGICTPSFLLGARPALRLHPHRQRKTGLRTATYSWWMNTSGTAAGSYNSSIRGGRTRLPTHNQMTGYSRLSGARGNSRVWRTCWSKIISDQQQFGRVCSRKVRRCALGFTTETQPCFITCTLED